MFVWVVVIDLGILVVSWVVWGFMVVVFVLGCEC